MTPKHVTFTLFLVLWQLFLQLVSPSKSLPRSLHFRRVGAKCFDVLLFGLKGVQKKERA